MLAFRTTWYIKPGKMGRAVELLLSEGQRFLEVRKAKGVDIAVEARIFTPVYSPDALILQICCESIAENEAYWASYDGDSEAGQAFWAEWHALVDRRVGSEIWKVHAG